MASQVDLSQLAVDRRNDDASSLKPKRVWLTRWGIPLVIITGFISVAGWSARGLWLPATDVTVVPVVLTKAEVQQSGTPLFQAAGWIEPRPTAVMCSALVEGVVAELLVVEGQEVAANEPVAKLVDADARISLRQAESVLQLREAERDAAKAVLTATIRNVEQPVQLEAAHAEAEATLAVLETEIKNLPFLIKSAEARLTFARQDFEGKKAVSDAIAGRLLQRAQNELDAAIAALSELQQRAPNLNHQLEAGRRKCEALHTKLKLKTDEIRARDEAKANLAAAEARLTQARLGIETATLSLERMIVRCPIHGRVLSLNAQPGRRVMGINAASERDASTVITVYDPQKLQVRADVRLEDVPQVQVGQPVQISTAAGKDMLTGRVLAMTSQADIQKNTLQVKVAIDTPSEVIRPEMLAQVVFLAPETSGVKSAEERNPLRLLAPKELIDNGNGSSTVWVADVARGVARRQSVQLGRAEGNQLIEVTQGLTALDKLIVSGREGLKDGGRIRITGNDRALGVSTSTAATMQPVSTALANPQLNK